jgi:hypothetical protein
MIYEIRNDGFDFQGFHLDPYVVSDVLPPSIDIDDAIQFYARDLKMKSFWRDVEAEFHPIEGLPVGPVPDICTWMGSSLVFSPKAYEALHSQLDNFGEFLPLLVDDERFYLFNCLTHGLHDELFSKSESLNSDGEVLQEERIRFNATDTKEKLLFKTKLNNCSVLYCNDAFRDLYLANQLTGITFDELV